MDEGEIVREYRAAKDGKKQINILADLNGCTKVDIAEILCNNNAISRTVLSNYQRGAQKKPYKKKPKAKAQTAPAPKSEQTPAPTPVLEDTGKRRVFASGAVRDVAQGKGRCDLLPAAALLRLAKHFENGAIKYGDRNWEDGIPASSLIDSAIRHTLEYLDGQQNEDHLCAAAWNLIALMQMEAKHPEMLDLPWQIANGKE